MAKRSKPEILVLAPTFLCAEETVNPEKDFLKGKNMLEKQVDEDERRRNGI